MNILLCTLERMNLIKFILIIPHIFEVTYEGTNKVEDKLFKMKLSESIGDMYTHFIDIINVLKVLGKSYTNW